LVVEETREERPFLLAGFGMFKSALK